jgi:dipeptidyl aminopeptidase/acylaminoacyl peptidase
VIAERAGRVYLCGEAMSIERRVPFLDALDCGTAERTRVWTSADTEHEGVVALLDGEGRRVLTHAESPSARPHFRVRDLMAGASRVIGSPAGAAKRDDVYSATPEHLVEVGESGRNCSLIVFRPAGVDPGERVPALVWIHPTIEALQHEPFSYGLNAHLPLGGVAPFVVLEHRFAVVPYPMMPIAGDPTTMADTFVEQLLAGCRRVVRLLSRSTHVDPNRLVIGGHSFGAYAAAMLLTHTDTFAAGIGISGMYNLATLPPGVLTRGQGFERAPDLCARLSPLCHVHRLRAPFLMVHRLDEVAPVDYVAQGRQMFEAIAAAGGVGRLVEIPGMRHELEAGERMLTIAREIAEWCGRGIARTSRPMPEAVAR